jgi:ribosomal protein S18 acetylase RimI-like enzyme
VTYAEHGTPYAEVSGPGEAEFRMLAVAGAARQRGVGETLVRACLDRARAAGCACLRLSTQPDMLAARRLYDRLGFRRTPEHDWSPLPGVELLTYEIAP